MLQTSTQGCELEDSEDKAWDPAQSKDSECQVPSHSQFQKTQTNPTERAESIEKGLVHPAGRGSWAEKDESWEAERRGLQAKASLGKPTALGNALRGAEGRVEQRARCMLAVNGERLSVHTASDCISEAGEAPNRVAIGHFYSVSPSPTLPSSPLSTLSFLLGKPTGGLGGRKGFDRKGLTQAPTRSTPL